MRPCAAHGTGPGSGALALLPVLLLEVETLRTLMPMHEASQAQQSATTAIGRPLARRLECRERWSLLSIAAV